MFHWRRVKLEEQDVMLFDVAVLVDSGEDVEVTVSHEESALNGAGLR